MAQPQIKTDIEARVQDTGDTMTGPLLLGNGRVKIATADNVLAFSLYNDINNPLNEYRQFRIISSLEGDSVDYALQLLDKEEEKELITYNILHTGNVSNFFKSYSRTEIGDSPNYDDPGINGIFELRITSETPNETGIKPFNAFGPFFSAKSNNAMLQLAGNSNGTSFMIRGCQKGNVNMAGIPWRTILTDYNYNQYALPLIGGKLSGTLYCNLDGNQIFLGADSQKKILFRNDGTVFYILCTNENETTWNNFRPFWINMSTGQAIINGGLLNFNAEATSQPTWLMTWDGGTCQPYRIDNLKILKSRILKHDTGYPQNNLSHWLEYFSGQPTIGTSAGNCYAGSSGDINLWSYPPEGTWSDGTNTNVQILRFGWGSTYFNELFTSPNYAGIYYRGVRNGTADPWRKIWLQGDTITGAVWNDYAEYRDQEEEVVPGYCVRSQRNGKLLLTTERLSPCDGVVSDTFGFAIGETEDNRTPIAVSGRVLVYVDGDRESYEIGDCLCAGPGGLAYRMSREEIKEYPDRIIGTVSEIPQYKVWGTGEVEVNNRIWINVK